MPLFEYVCINANGKKEKNSLSADCLETAKELLRKQKLLIVNVSLIKKKNHKIQLSAQQKLNFTRQMAQLLKSGLPLYESLKMIEEKFSHTRYHFLFVDLADMVRHGSSFSKALAMYPKTFNSIYISMIAAGEETGCLEQVFDQLKVMIEKEEKLRKKLSSAMIYPSFLAIFCFVVIFSMFFFLIPSLKELFEGRTLHPITKVVIQISDFLRSNGVVIVIGGLFFLLVGLSFFKSAKGKKIFQSVGIRIPIISKLWLYSIIVRFSKSMSALLSSGVSLIDSLRLSKAVMNHHLLAQSIEDAIQNIIQGEKLSEQIKKVPLFPVIVSRMVATAEESGSVDAMFEHIGEMYQEDLEKSIEQFLQILQPMIILFLGLIVGFVILSIMIPLTDVSSFLH